MRPILLTMTCWLVVTATASAQVYVRAPFVRVQTGPGVSVQAPFVNVFVPPPAPVFVVPPPSIYIPPRPVVVAPLVQVVPPVTPAQPVPAVVQPIGAQTLDQFAAGFKAKGGTFDADLMNPVTGQATRVRFTLPEGAPKRVIVNAREIEFRYGLFHFVRIEFDRNGAQVVTRSGR